MADLMIFPDDVYDFIEQYGIRDTEEVYTNGSMLIPVFRVEQMIDHYFRERTCHITYREDYAPEQSDCQIIECSNGCFFYWPTITPLFYCPKCGARVVNENKPVEVWQQASADDVTCYEVEQ